MINLLDLTPSSINEPLGGGERAAITSLSPQQCVIGAADFTLYVHGTGFGPESVIVFAGHDEPTTFNEADGTVSTGVKPSLWASPVVVQCQVRNGVIPSNAVDFAFTAAAADAEMADPDDLEEEIEQEIDDGDIAPTHRRPHKRKK